MMPRLPLLVLRYVILAVALISVIFVTVLWPSRHSLATFWPDPVDEMLVQTPDGSVRRLFRTPAAPVSPDGELIALDRPLSLVAVERLSGEVFFANLVGIRSRPDAPLRAGFPGDADANCVDADSLGDTILVLIEAGGAETERPTDGIVRLYRPNRLRLDERLAITWSRVLKAWRPLPDSGERPAGEAHSIPPQDPETP